MCDGYAAISGVRLEPPDDSKLLVSIPDGFADYLAERIRGVVKESIDKEFGGTTATTDDDEEAGPPTAAPERVVSPQPIKTPEPVDDLEKFRVVHNGPVREDGKRTCRAEPFKPGMTNTWKDDGKLAAKDIADSKKLSKKKKPEPRRPPAPKVEVQCWKCNRQELVEPIFAASADGEGRNYVCNRCIRRGGG